MACARVTLSHHGSHHMVAMVYEASMLVGRGARVVCQEVGARHWEKGRAVPRPVG